MADEPARPIDDPGPRRHELWANHPVSAGQLVAVGPDGLVAPTLGATRWWVGTAATDSRTDQGGVLWVLIGDQQQARAHEAIDAGALLVAGPAGTVAPAPTDTDATLLVGIADHDAQAGAELTVRMLR